MDDLPTTNFVRVGRLEELKARGRLVVRGPHRPILVVYDHGRIFALDNRCPHMGFPLERGSVEDGILTCHWHHARFDLASGCTFDLWADDVPSCPVEVRGSEIWVQPTFGHADPAAHWRRRLDDGLAHDLGLVIAKAVYGELAADVPPANVVGQIALYGARNRDGWGVGLTILTALGNLRSVLPEEETYLALFHGGRRVAADCAGQAPRHARAPLAASPDFATLKRWLRRWTAVRHREAAERTLLTAIAAGAAPAALAELMFAAGTDRVFADAGHSLDFINKAFECLDLIGWEHAAVVLPTVVGQMIAARGAEESTAWRQPADLIVLCQTAAAKLPRLIAESRGRGRWSDHAALAHALLGDEPVAIMDAVESAVCAGATPPDLGRSLAYAAALRVARFGSANEHADWETAHHVFTYANAVHGMLARMATAEETGRAEAVRGVLHGAMARWSAIAPSRPLSQCAARPHPRRRRRSARGSAQRCRGAVRGSVGCLRSATAGRFRGASCGPLSHARPCAAGADCYIGMGAAAGRCEFPQLSNAGGRSAPIRDVGRGRARPTHPHRGRALSRGPFAD